MLYLLKVLITALLVVAVAELAKRSSLLAGLVASIPLVSVLAMIWLYLDTGNPTLVGNLARDVFWLVLPSLALFLLLPWLLERQLGFFPSLGIAVLATLVCYGLTLVLLQQFGPPR